MSEADPKSEKSLEEQVAELRAALAHLRNAVEATATIAFENPRLAVNAFVSGGPSEEGVKTVRDASQTLERSLAEATRLIWGEEAGGGKS